MRNFLLPNKQEKPSSHDKILKATALMYLKEALVKEVYEDCPELIQNAKDFGAEQKEISELIAEHITGVVKERQKKATSRRRF